MASRQEPDEPQENQREGGGRQDWARITGTLQAGAQFHVFLMGDWIRDQEFTRPGLRQRQLFGSLSMAYSFGRSTLTASGGYSKLADLAPSDPAQVPQMGRRNLYYSLGFSSRLGKMLFGFLATRYDQGDGLPLTSYSVYDTLAFRNISFRVILDRSTRPDGWKVTRLSVDLLRLFDTVVFGGFGRK